MHKQMEAILTRVQKPARYVGGEWGSVMKDKKNVDLRFAFCFPDTYEVAMSHLGSRILYGLLNDQKGIWCERVCAPWIDMEAEMRAAGIPLYGLESGDPLTIGIYLDDNTYFEGTGYVQSFDISAAPDDKISLTSEIAGSGATTLTLPA